MNSSRRGKLSAVVIYYLFDEIIQRGNTIARGARAFINSCTFR